MRGIGLIAGRPDDKFALAPGQTGDARFTLFWAGQQLFGNTFNLDLTVREIIPAGNGQSTLGPEYPLQIVGLVDGARAGAPVAQAGEAAPCSLLGPGVREAGRPALRRLHPGRRRRAGRRPLRRPSVTIGPPTAAGGAHCPAGAISCYDAGPFSVTVLQTIPVQGGKNQLVRFSIRVKNQTAQPLVLAYKAGTNAAVDEQGNAFSWGRPGTHDASVQGIGMVEGARIDPQFQIAPGTTRDAQLSVSRYDATRPPGKSFTLDTVLVELRSAPGGQWQKVREYAVHLPGSGSAAAPAVGQNPTTNDHVQKAGDLLKGLLGGSRPAVEGDHPEQEEEAERDQHVPPGMELGVRDAVRRGA